MQIETYEIEETKDELAVMASDSEAFELAEKLGLSGQASLTNKETVTRFPYRKMTSEESNIYGLLFPKKTLVENYCDGIIPLRVLQVIAHVRELEFLDKIHVWHPENADDKDPVLVGSRKHPTEAYTTEIFILARWGDALESLDKLAIKAKKIWLNKVKASLVKAETELRVAIEKVKQIESSDVIPKLTGSCSFYETLLD